jgi:predicted extracellular nuclease
VSLATFNLANLFDNQDDPAVDDDVLSAPEYQRRLYKRAMAIHAALSEPAVLAVQEVENAAILHALVADPDVLQADYQALLVDGPDSRGLDVALMYRSEQVWPLDYAIHQGCTALVDGLGPDGNGDPLNPVNTPTCDLNGDGLVDGNRLFSRPPLAVRLQLEQAHPPGAARKEIWVIVNHWKSKVEDTATQLYTQPRRNEQARFVADLADQLRSLHPTLEQFVLGDLNDAASSPALQQLLGRGFQDISAQIPRSSRYTYNYQGVSQSMDYILWRPAGGLGLQSVAVLHINADFPPTWANDLSHYRRSSDHDPLLARLLLADYWLRLPLVLRP